MDIICRYSEGEIISGPDGWLLAISCDNYAISIIIFSTTGLYYLSYFTIFQHFFKQHSNFLFKLLTRLTWYRLLLASQTQNSNEYHSILE